MNQNDTLYKEVALTVSKEDAQLLGLYFDEGKLPELNGYYEVLYTENREKSDDSTSLVLYFSADDAAVRLKLELFLTALGIDTYKIDEKEIESRDYLESYKQHYHAFSLSERIRIVPSWEKTDENEKAVAQARQIPLYLDPGLAFGTGLHPTTALCMEFLDRAITSETRLIDAGCGSGILSIGALLLGCREVFAFDIDGNAKLAVEHNLEINPSVRERFTFRKGGFDLPEFTEYRADLLVANITASTILTNRERIHAGRYDTMFLSGILSEKGDEIVAAFPEWTLMDRKERDGWIVMSFQRRKNL